MNTKRLGASEIWLPEIGLGTWKYTSGVEPLRVGIDNGAFLIDTAEIYGTEEIVGEAVRGRREHVFLATKIAPRNFRCSDLIAAAERSLHRLGTDYIDLYQLHWPNDTVPIGETMAAMEKLVDSGKVRFIGLSNFTLPELKKAQKALSKHKIVSNQVRYSLIERTIANGLLQYCQRHEITIIAHSPLGSGIQRVRSRDPDDVLTRIARSAGKSEAQIALNWILAQDRVIAIPKASTPTHAVDNCGASGWHLSLGDYNLLNAKIRCTSRGPLASALRSHVRHAAQLLGRRLQ